MTPTPHSSDGKDFESDGKDLDRAGGPRRAPSQRRGDRAAGEVAADATSERASRTRRTKAGAPADDARADASRKARSSEPRSGESKSRVTKSRAVSGRDPKVRDAKSRPATDGNAPAVERRGASATDAVLAAVTGEAVHANGYAIAGAAPVTLSANGPAGDTSGGTRRTDVVAGRADEGDAAAPSVGGTGASSGDGPDLPPTGSPTAVFGFDAPDADAPPPFEEPLPTGRYINRELSWLDFNARVLTLAEDTKRPLMERAKFLAIFSRNLDEFYMVRVAELKRRMQTGLPLRTADGMSIREQLALITERTAELVARHAHCFEDVVGPELTDAGVEIVHWEELDSNERDRMRDYFRSQVFPVLTPLAVDPVHPFPYISGLALNLAVVARDPDGGPEFFARVKVPNNVPRLILVSGDPRVRVRYLPLEDLIAAHLGGLFSGMRIVEHHVFRVTRNAELEVDDDRDEDLLQALERELARRRFGPPVRLEVASTMSDHVLELLVRELDMDPGDVLRVPGVLDLTALWGLYDDVDRPDLKDKPFVPATHPRFLESEPTHVLGGGETSGRRSVFAMLRDGDVLVHHPYHSFSTSVQRFIEQAAGDPDVLAIKQTLYRTSGDSPVIDALVDAAEAGKQVVVIVEVKARFDEQANIGWARTLEKAGCHVVYGLVGLKTHCKIALVVRREGNQIRRYAHIGTGNYHPKTARAYEDLGLLTADPEIGADLTDLFNMLTG
ncbi:MAG TPA: polyphosphate kinase 1, partial [Micromonosporaceae bacterium]